MKIRNDEEHATLLELFVKLERANRAPAPDLREEKVAYGVDPRQYYLTFCPEGRAVSRHVLIFFHGGGWRMGSPGDFRCVGRFFARLGFQTVLPAYRLVPDFRFPAQMEDVFAVTQKVLQQVQATGDSHGQAIIVGQSAGAHLGALVVYNQAEQRKYGLTPEDFAGFVSISGPLNFSVCKNRSEVGLIKALARSAEDFVKADPFHYLTGSENLPVLCIHGDEDPLVELENSTTFVEQINAFRPGLAQLLLVQGGHHSDLVKLFLGEMAEVAILKQWLQERE